ncbi:26S proteasome non-ATPase regulatory subunit 1 [Eufriesea mexicana]|uniref:26S proteasome non-ATPase regulatory subunit 1 n=1 Tax=Eufriesea mexicana TaxID=516756 RepID=A0A310S985_9HYME|nr:26S proteasome non-ATPase regulatory subunit 1 [Eufriesea mexicana]
MDEINTQKCDNNIDISNEDENNIKIIDADKTSINKRNMDKITLDEIDYAQETQHEKILRGLAVGIAFTMYGRLEEADPLVSSLCSDKDPILRRSGMYTLAMAYCGTGNNQAIRKLLHVAVQICYYVGTEVFSLITKSSSLCDMGKSIVKSCYNNIVVLMSSVSCCTSLYLRGIACWYRSAIMLELKDLVWLLKALASLTWENQ